MKKVLIIITLLIFAFAIKGLAYDFSAVCSTGQTLYYNIVDSVVWVTYPCYRATSDYNHYAPPYSTYYYSHEGYTGWQQQRVFIELPRPTGIMIVPDSVVFNNQTYPVKGIGAHSFDACSGLQSVKP